MKHFLRKRIISGLLITCCLSTPIHFAYGQGYRIVSIPGAKIMSEEAQDASTKDPYRYFQDADATVQALVQKITRQIPITLNEVKALPEGALNARYGKEITLLYFALLQRNLQAVDILLKAGADPYAVTHPSQNDKFDFTYVMTQVSVPGSYEDNKKFRTELLRIYLANGGDPSHRWLFDMKSPLLAYVIFWNNYQDGRILIDAGADVLATDTSGESVASMLAIDRDKEGSKLLRDIVCSGAYDNANEKQMKDVIKSLSLIMGENTVREERHRRLAVYILKSHPDYKDDRYTREMFEGPIPWKKVLASDDKELCSVK